MYAMGELVTQAMRDRGMARKDLVKALGYKNTPKGRRNLDACLDKGVCSNAFLRKNFPPVLGLDPAKVEEAIRLTEEQKKQEANRVARARFEPHIYIEVRRTFPIFAIAFSGAGRNLYIDLPPELPSLSEEEQMERVGQIVREHYVANGGKCELVGASNFMSSAGSRMNPSSSSPTERSRPDTTSPTGRPEPRCKSGIKSSKGEGTSGLHRRPMQGRGFFLSRKGTRVRVWTSPLAEGKARRRAGDGREAPGGDPVQDHPPGRDSDSRVSGLSVA